jgi:hypothetical protein
MTNLVDCPQQSRYILDTKFLVTAGITTAALGAVIFTWPGISNLHYTSALISLLMLTERYILHETLAIITGFKGNANVLPLSFGWLGYMVSILRIVYFGNRKMMPKPEMTARWSIWRLVNPTKTTLGFCLVYSTIIGIYLVVVPVSYALL